MTTARNLLGLASGASLGGGIAGLALRGRIAPEAPYSPADSEVVKNFIAHTKTWTPTADPREMAHDYAEVGHPAANVSLAGLRLGDIAEMSHSLPGTSPWDPSYSNHYKAFQTGPLSGYNIRAHEFQNEYGLRNKDTGMTLGDVLTGANTGQMPNHPEYSPALARLKSDIDATGLHARSDIGDLTGRLREHEQEMASGHGWGTDIDKLTPDQQHQILSDLNTHLQQHNPQDYVDRQVLDTLMGYDVPRAGHAYGLVGHGVEATGHALNAGHDAALFATEHPGALIGGGAAGLALSLLNSRMHRDEPKTPAFESPALAILAARSRV